MLELLGGEMQEFILLVLVGFLLKHFVADYLLQFGWMIAGKGNFRSLGGYVHAGIHALGSAIVLSMASVPVLALVALITVEFVIHYMLDYLKIRYSRDISNTEQPHLFWALNGLDQLMHHLTYIGMTYAVVLSVR